MARLIFPVVVGVFGTAILISLGIWQMQRLAWKEEMLAQIGVQITAAPAPLALRPASEIKEFAPVSVAGRFLDGEAHVLRSIKGQGVVFRIIAPFETLTGRRILVDRGYVLEAQKMAKRPIGATQIIGNFRTPEEVDVFTPAPDWENNFIFARDVDQLSEHFDTEPLLLILRETSEARPQVTPWPVDTNSIPNNHLQYAIIWFSLALVWLGMTALWIVRKRRNDS